MGVNIKIKTDQKRIRPLGSEVERLFGDNSKLLKLTSWRPSYGGPDGFRRGLKETVEWFTEPSNLSLYKPDKYAV